MPEAIQTAVRNNGGGVLNHNLFFDGMTPASSKAPVGRLAEAINRDFGSFENFKETFKKPLWDVSDPAGPGSVSDENGNLKIVSTANQDVPMNLRVNPILKSTFGSTLITSNIRTRRAEYIDNWFNVIDWNKAEELYNNPIV